MCSTTSALPDLPKGPGEVIPDSWSDDPDREYDEPNRLPVARGRQYGYDCKEFSDLINPLKRYLRSCIGKLWKKVHSELSRKLDRRSLSGSHIWDHVMWEIETDCYIGEDRLAYPNKRTYHLSRFPVDGLYVHPKTGLIREQHPMRKRRWIAGPLWETMLKGIALAPISGVDGSARLAVIFGETSTGRQLRVSYPDYQYLRDHNRAFSGLFGSSVVTANLRPIASTSWDHRSQWLDPQRTLRNRG